ncbi:MAG TPA: hypothetical protein VG709_00550 [Actinomycetota bacterium]|nr:hypothetical protein [Actinomycetota bacterium]
MDTYTDSVERVADRLIDVVRKADDAAVAAAAGASNAVARFMPDLRGSALERLPKPEQFVRVYFDFVERLVKTQRTYSMDLVKAIEPVSRKIWPAPKVRKAAA